VGCWAEGREASWACSRPKPNPAIVKTNITATELDFRIADLQL
jgi:hypothetical protein